MKRRPWSDEDRRRFAEQKLRAQSIPPKRDDGPSVDEWELDGYTWCEVCGFHWEPDTRCPYH